MIPIRMRSRIDPMRRLTSTVKRTGDDDGRGERRTEMMIGKKTRPSPEISRSLRSGRGKIG